MNGEQLKYKRRDIPAYSFIPRHIDAYRRFALVYVILNLKKTL